MGTESEKVTLSGSSGCPVIPQLLDKPTVEGGHVYSFVSTADLDITPCLYKGKAVKPLIYL